MSHKNRRWAAALGLVLVLLLGLGGWLARSRPTGSQIQILQDGALLYEIDLSRVTEPYPLRICWGEGYNDILVEPNRICITDSDCPDRICVRRGWLTSGGAPIVCLPHRLVIQCVPAGMDTVAQ